MNLPISDRLLACCSFVAPGARVADVGCDHGYLSIYLLTRGIASRIIASDINEGPLDSARRNAEKYGVKDKMSFHLSAGVKNIPRDFDVLVCAGMGADTMVSILSAAPWLQSDAYRLILQCQSKTPMLRKYLSETGWRIAREAVLRDGKFLYTVMDVRWEPGSPKLTVGQWYLPPALLPSAERSAYRKWVMDGLKIATAHRSDPEKAQALAELSFFMEE